MWRSVSFIQAWLLVCAGETVEIGGLVCLVSTILRVFQKPGEPTIS